MWIMTNTAFVSVVAPTPGTPAARADQLVVRARVKGHITNLFPRAKVTVGAGTDYEFRACIDRDEVAACIAKNIRAVNYGNFKNSVKAKPYHNALMGVWTVMHRLQMAMMPKRNRGSQRSLGYAGPYPENDAFDHLDRATGFPSYDGGLHAR